MKGYFYLSIALIFLFFTKAKSEVPDQIVGVWKSSNEGFLVKIDKVGNHFQGRIISLESSETDALVLDENNPVEHLKKLPLKGNKIINKLSFNPTATQWDGSFYNYKDGKIYQCTISLQNEDRLKITGFIKNQKEKIIENWNRL